MSKIRLSCDDGGASDVRVAELAKKYGIETVFYWPVEWHSLAYENGYRPLTLEQAWGISEHFEIGSHTITHRHLTKIPKEEAEYEIRYSWHFLNELFGDIHKFAPPRGYTNEELTEYTMQVYNSQRLTRGPGLVHIHPNSGANDNMPWEVAAIQKRGPSPPFNDIEVWCHSWELDKYNLWDELEEFLRENSSR